MSGEFCRDEALTTVADALTTGSARPPKRTCYRPRTPLARRHATRRSRASRQAQQGEGRPGLEYVLAPGRKLDRIGQRAR